MKLTKIIFLVTKVKRTAKVEGMITILQEFKYTSEIQTADDVDNDACLSTLWINAAHNFCKRNSFRRISKRVSRRADVEMNWTSLCLKVVYSSCSQKSISDSFHLFTKIIKRTVTTQSHYKINVSFIKFLHYCGTSAFSLYIILIIELQLIISR